MKKYILGDHPQIILNFYADNTKFFGRMYKGNMPDLGEKIKAFRREGGKIIVIGSSYTRCNITANNLRLDKIEQILNNYIDASIGDVKNIEID